ncbi:MAG: peptidylprolyl isomerase [Leadbetterella sp.]
MAIVNKIRERSGIVVGVVAIALILFMLGQDTLTGKFGNLFGNDNTIGKIGSKNISYEEFTNLFNIQKANYESQGASMQEQQQAQVREQIWEKLIFDNVLVKEYEKLGITVSDEELKELVQGPKYMHPYVKQQFADQAGNFDAAAHANFIKAYLDNKLNVQQITAWDNLKRELKNMRMREKYAKLLEKMTLITNAEAKQEYIAQTEKASANILYVPFNFIPDSTVKVEDSEIRDYYNAHKDDFAPFDNRSVAFVSVTLTPTKADSNAMSKDLVSLARGLASAKDPVGFARENSDIKFSALRGANELGAEIKTALSTAIVGAIVGPFREGSTYSIHKFLGSETDTLFTARASHILIRSDSTMSDSARAMARKTALEVLIKAQTGAPFEQLASQYGTDGTAQKGGDLGVMRNNGQMVKPFENAVFGFSGTGVIPNLVETDFGLHIVKVTEAKSNLKYRLVTIAKELIVGDAALNNTQNKLESLRAKSKNLAELEANVKKDPSLAIQYADNVFPGSRNLNMLPDAGTIVNWAYRDAKDGDVAGEVFSIGNNTMVVAALKNAADKSEPDAMDFKDQILAKIRNTKKGEKIIAKLGSNSGTLGDMAKKYGAGALNEQVADISYFSGMLNSAGFDPTGLGKIFGQKIGQKSKPFVGENGVLIVETTAKTAAPAIADYSGFKQQIVQRNGPTNGMIGEQILRENAKIVDSRYKFF